MRSEDCGIGATWRKRKILEIGDTLGCNTALEEAKESLDRASRLGEVKACEERQCEGIDCLWGESGSSSLCISFHVRWEAWGACTSSCGGGVKRRNRVIVVAPRNGGRLCEPKDKYQAPKGSKRIQKAF